MSSSRVLPRASMDASELLSRGFLLSASCVVMRRPPSTHPASVFVACSLSSRNPNVMNPYGHCFFFLQLERATVSVSSHLRKSALVPGFGQTADHRGAAAGAGARIGRAGGRSRGGGRRGGLGTSGRSVRARLRLGGGRRCALGSGDVGRGRRWRSGGGGGHVRLLDAGTLRLLRLRLGLGGALRRAPRRSSRDRHRARAATCVVALDALDVVSFASALRFSSKDARFSALPEESPRCTSRLFNSEPRR